MRLLSESSDGICNVPDIVAITWLSISANNASGIYISCSYLGVQSSSVSQFHFVISESNTPSTFIASHSMFGQ